VAVAADAKCEPEADGDYTSFAWPGGLDHVVIAKKDTKQNVCLRIQIDYPNDFPLFPLTMPSQWGASQISLSNNAADCDDLKKPPTGAQAWAKAATGSISWPPSKGMLYPCKIDMDVSITVDFPPPGVQANQEMKAQMIHVEGGCM